MREFIEKLIGRLEKKENEAVLKAPNTSNISNIEYQKWMMKSYGFKESIEIVKQLAEEYNQDSTKVSQGWISCSERLPEPYKTVLIQYHSKVNDFDKIVLAHLHLDMGWSWKIEFGGACDSDCVLAWQPLPAPYQPKGE